jgi:SAM-dependent methyltransferase
VGLASSLSPSDRLEAYPTTTREKVMLATLAGRVLRRMPVSALETGRWDREWVHYLNLHGTSGYLLDHAQMQPLPGALEHLAALRDDETLAARIFEPLAPLHVWAPGAALVDKNVLEIGCGPGYLGKQLGYVARSYLGLDYSQLALCVARAVSPQTCTYLHLSQHKDILRWRGRIDTMVGRFFFIHQNFDNALWLLQLAHLLLRPRGQVHADFYHADTTVEQGVVFPARSSLSPQHPSCAFDYREDDVRELARRSSLTLVKTHRDVAMQRLFARFEKAT